jgi:hypothetical protein
MAVLGFFFFFKYSTLQFWYALVMARDLNCVGLSKSLTRFREKLCYGIYESLKTSKGGAFGWLCGSLADGSVFWGVSELCC